MCKIRGKNEVKVFQFFNSIQVFNEKYGAYNVQSYYINIYTMCKNFNTEMLHITTMRMSKRFPILNEKRWISFC